MTPELLDRDMARRARYSQGAGIMRIIPAAVARPRDIGMLRATIGDARNASLSITPRGAGTAMDGGNIGPGLVLDLSSFDSGGCDVDAIARRAIVSPSLTLAELRAAAAPHGLRLPPEPSSAAWATLGGMVSTNAAGAASLRHGSIRPWIEALTLETVDGPLHLARGESPPGTHPVVGRWAQQVVPVLEQHRDEIRRRYPAVRKNSAGYALDHWLAHRELIDVVIGSEGTLGVITRLTVRLDAQPAVRMSLRAVLDRRDHLEPAIEAIRPYDPETLEFLDESFLGVIRRTQQSVDTDAALLGAGSILLADFTGDDASEVSARMAAAAAATAPHARIDLALRPDEIERLWAVRHGASPALAALEDGRRSLQVVEDGCVPPGALQAYIEAVDAACRSAGVDVVIFGHAGDGHVHVNLLPRTGDPSWPDRIAAVYRRVSGDVIALGGTPSGEHGAGRLRAPLLGALYGEAVMQCHAAVKDAFDPIGLFNPGVIIGRADPLASLKLGPNAPAIPADADEWLADLERTADWGRCRW
ncbi:MAG: FAD-binding oxidoreductase [Gemmatimonadales bacterium]|nr:FAD-binding oxidoreductase [Gemmatimonadales bacterium]